jgi:SRSO17 transposase
MVVRNINHERMPQAPREAMPELAEFLEPMRVHFTQAPSADTLRQYVTGLLSDQPKKNSQTLPDVIPETNQQQFNHLLTEMVWDADALNRQRIARLLELPTEGDGVLVFDDCGFEKKGESSVGVARQYTGTAGKVTNCQVCVNCVYAERTLAWPVASRLYLPREWTDDPARCAKAHVPEEITFQTKADIALDLLDEADKCQIQYSCVVTDGDYGDNPNFLNGLEERGKFYVCAVRCDFSVTLSRSEQSRVERADEVIGAQPLSEWETISWREGSRGRLRAKFIALRCWRVDGDGTRHTGWLIGERPARSQRGQWKYSWSNFGPQMPLEKMVEYVHRRHWVEQYHEEAKGELGWDEHQGRRWDSFHRHTVSVMLAYSFLVWLEYKQRLKQAQRGRLRPPFSP